MLTHFSLFSGIGGIDLAAECAGFKSVGQCEWADYQTKVLEKHWPDVSRWRDVRDVTIESINQRGIKNITVLSAGFPCQPHSIAGKREASNDERDLWGETARVIGETNPRWFLGENVPGLLSSEDGWFFGRILNDMERMGYNVGWCCFPISVIGGVFEGERVFIIGTTYSKSELQTYKEISSIGSERKAWESITWSNRREIPGVYWEENKSPVCGMDDGFSSELDKNRLIALGNAVVPQQVYPILKAIADVELGGNL